MKYVHIVNYVASSIWAIDRDKIDEILNALAFRAAGHILAQDEVDAIVAARSTAPAAVSARGVAVIPIRGVISHRGSGMAESSGGTSTESIGRMLSAVEADDTIGTIVYDIDSPGGTVTGVPELADRMFGLRGKIRQIAHVNGEMASGAYWLGSQADEIVSLPTGGTGSIGVFTVHKDLSGALEKEGVKVTMISAGKYKTEGNPLGPLSDEALAFRQARVDDAYKQFVSAVARGRGVSVADVKGGFGEGRVLDGKAAKAAGMIDRVATFEDTISRVVGRAGGSLLAEQDALDLVSQSFESNLRRRIEGL